MNENKSRDFSKNIIKKSTKYIGVGTLALLTSSSVVAPSILSAKPLDRVQTNVFAEFKQKTDKYTLTTKFGPFQRIVTSADLIGKSAVNYMLKGTHVYGKPKIVKSVDKNNKKVLTVSGLHANKGYKIKSVKVVEQKDKYDIKVNIDKVDVKVDVRYKKNSLTINRKLTLGEAININSSDFKLSGKPRIDVRRVNGKEQYVVTNLKANKGAFYKVKFSEDVRKNVNMKIFVFDKK